MLEEQILKNIGKGIKITNLIKFIKDYNSIEIQTCVISLINEGILKITNEYVIKHNIEKYDVNKKL